MSELAHNSLVSIEVKDMSSLPIDSNPFHYDASSMGTELVRGWMAMHAGYDRKEQPQALGGLYLYNARSGQRIQIKFVERPVTKRAHILAAAEHLNTVRTHMMAAGLSVAPLFDVLDSLLDERDTVEGEEVFSTIPPTL